MKEREIRSITNEFTIEDNESRTIEGYALLFEHESNDLGGFVEVIKREAVTETMINNSDVVALFNHDSNRGILARSTKGSGSLELILDEKGLRYKFDAPNTALGNEMIELLKRGDLRESSFAFTCKKDTWERKGDSYIRYINEIDRLYDVSIVINPAYSETLVKCRSYETMKEQLSNELTSYYLQLKESIK